MSLDFPTKKAVFVKFGTPTRKETFENIENWYYKLSEVTNSTSLGFAYGNGFIKQDPLNRLLKPIDKAIITNEHTLNAQKTNTTTVETYVKFWFINDTVVKWETFGVDYTRSIVNTPNDESIMCSGEFLFTDSTEHLNIYSHKSLTRRVLSGINGPMKLSAVENLLTSHPDFRRAFLPTIDDLIRIYSTESKLRGLAIKQSLTVWSETISTAGNVKCFDFKTGTVVEKSPESLNHFIPLVGVLNR